MLSTGFKAFYQQLDTRERRRCPYNPYKAGWEVLTFGDGDNGWKFAAFVPTQRENMGKCVFLRVLLLWIVQVEKSFGNVGMLSGTDVFETGYRPQTFGRITYSGIWNLLWEINEHNVFYLKWWVILGGRILDGNVPSHPILVSKSHFLPKWVFRYPPEKNIQLCFRKHVLYFNCTRNH